MVARVPRGLAVFGTAVIVAAGCSSAATAASPSAACAAVNSGAFDFLGSPASTSYSLLSGFVAGEQINAVVSGSNDPQWQLRTDPQTTTKINITATSTPQSASYTVTGTGDTTLVAWTMATGGPQSISATVTCTAASSSGAGASVPATTQAFILNRVNGILLSNPGQTSLLNRLAINGGVSAITSETLVAGSATAFGSTMMGLGAGHPGEAEQGALGSQSVHFSNSLSQMRRQTAAARMERERMALGAGDGGALPLTYETASRWDLWVEGRYSAFDDNAGNLNRKGHVGVLSVGSDYRVTENLMIGALVQFDSAKDASDVLASKIEGNGWMVGPYLSARIHDNVYFDLRAAWGRSSNDLTLGAATGDFDTSRWLVKGALAGNWQHGAWRFTPSAEIAYVEERAEAFTDSSGTVVDGQDVALGRLQFGPEVGYRFAHTADTFIEPFAAIRGVWDFDNPNAVVGGVETGPGDFWGRLEGGLNVMTTSGWYVRGLASWDGIGASNYTGYTLQGAVNVPLN